MRAKKGNLLLVFVFLMAFLGMVVAYALLISGVLRGAAAKEDSVSAFYVAEAGLQKAIWYLNTPTAMGGRGTGWRTSGTAEAYGEGSFLLKVQNSGTSRILITAEGTVRDTTRRVQITLQSSGLPPAFDYALFSNGGLTLKSTTLFQGNVFANGNVKVNNPAMVLGGTVSYAPGYGVSGTGVYTDGGVPEHLPEMPVLDNSYYENLIAVADSSDPQVLHGDQHFSDYDFSGPPVFVDGDVTISGVTNGGGGTIVANGDIRVSGVLTGPVNIFSGEDIEVSGPAVISSTANLLYASENIGASSSTVIYGSLLSAGIGISGSAAIYGILYSWDMAVDFSGGAAVQGSVVNPASHTYNGNVVLNYDPAFLPAVPPPGMSGGGLEIVAGSVKAM